MSVRSTGRRTFFHQRGANAFLDDGCFDFSSTTARIFHLGYLLLLDRLDQPDAEYGTVAARVLCRAREAGCKTSVDVVSEDSQRFADVVPSTLPYVDYCILNEFEIERTSGIQTRNDGAIDLAAIHKASAHLLEAGVKDWVIVHFPEGACALGRDGVLRSRGSLCLPQSEIIGTVGAGDAFAAGVLYGLHEGCEVETALLYGAAAAASCLSGAGASDGVKTLDECLALEKAFGSRSL
jgi:sugar/nucleoside kinase (ribokinase family)